jgi:hypothetical protein
MMKKTVRIALSLCSRILFLPMGASTHPAMNSEFAS